MPENKDIRNPVAHLIATGIAMNGNAHNWID